MNPHVLFWIPAALRLAFIWIGSAVLWYFFGPIIGLLAGAGVHDGDYRLPALLFI